MDDLIQLTNKLQTVVSSISTQETLDLPQIVVVGAQSSGKSSVLETIVQRDFLPRGSGIVTRRPLVLQLVTSRQPDAVEYGEFLHTQDRKFFDFAEIRREIERETSRLAGDNKGISRMPIHLRIYSPKVLTLTLVDLPGLTKIPIGDQPTDIEKQIRSLLMDYVTKPNSIILAVTPANMDLVNSDSLKLARQVDPEGKRTIGVLTKLDLMDAGTNALDVLTGRSYPLKLGFIGIVNRSQQDILTNKPMADALKAENDFFRQHPSYRAIASRCGTQYLSKQLNQILFNHIKDKLPELRTKLSSLISQTQHDLAQYGDPALTTGTMHRGSLILRLLTKFANDFVAAIDGTSSEMSTKELCGGARIYYIFNNVFGNALIAIPPCANLTNNDIRTAIRNSTGPRPSLFVPEIAFDLLVKPQIKLLETPSLRCVELVYEELMKICHNSGDKELMRYPKLQAKLVEVVAELLRERLGPTSTYVESLIAIERAYINTNHPDFMGAAGAMTNLETETKKKKKQESSSNSKRRLNRQPSLNSVSSMVRASGPYMDDDNKSTTTTTMDSGSSLGGGHGQQQQDSFLNYFFGGASKAERPALGGGSPEMTNGLSPHQHYAPTMSVSSLMESEIEKKMEHVTIQHGNGEETTYPVSDREEIETQLIRTLITNYFNIVRKNIQDLVPKSVMHLLVNHSRESVQNRLVTSLYKRELFDELLQEDEAMAIERSKSGDVLLEIDATLNDDLTFAPVSQPSWLHQILVLSTMGRGEKVDYRLSMLVVLCKDCNQDVGLYPARHQCQVERPPLPPLPPIPTTIPSDNAPPSSPPATSLLRKASSPSLSRFATTRQTPTKTATDQPMTRAQSTTASSRWSPSSRFGRSANSKNTSPTEEKGEDPLMDSSYFDHFSAHLPATLAEQPTTSLKKKWGGSIKQNQKWKQLNDKVDQQKQQQSSPKLWKRLVQATQNLAAQEDQGPESDESDWEGESHISRVLRQYHEKKEQKQLPSWLLLDGKASNRNSDEETSELLLNRQSSTSRRRLWDSNNATPTARELELEALRQTQPHPRSRRPMSHDSDRSDDIDDDHTGDQHIQQRKNKRLERMQSARRCMEDQYRDVVFAPEDRPRVYRQQTQRIKVDDLLSQARQTAALSRSRSDRAIRNAYHDYGTTATEITPTNYRSYLARQDKPLDDLTLKRPKQRYLVPEQRDGLGLF